jgi:myo-inositol-1(or 4)-monophosphatase
MRETLIKAARTAGEIQMKYYGKDVNIESKGEKGIVTQADKEAEEKILSVLREQYDYGVVAEESGTSKKDSEYYWVIDPIDGTTNYSRKIPFFCVSIALFKQNQPEAAVIYQPVMDELFYAQRGQGAYLNDVRIFRNEPEEPVLVDINKGRGKEPREKYLNALKSIPDRYTDTVILGSSALELAYLAAGRLDCFLTYGDEIYDVAAGILIAEEAGCLISNWKGETWQPEDPELLAAPPEFHRELRGYLSGFESKV